MTHHETLAEQIAAVTPTEFREPFPGVSRDGTTFTITLNSEEVAVVMGTLALIAYPQIFNGKPTPEGVDAILALVKRFPEVEDMAHADEPLGLWDTDGK